MKLNIKRLNITAVLTMLLLISNCEIDNAVKDAAMKDRPSYDFQKTYLLRQAPLYFSIHYNIWKNLPIDLMNLGDTIGEFKAMKTFKAVQKIELVGQSFEIEDRINKKKYFLKQENNIDNKKYYSISTENKIIGEIKQLEEKNILNFELIYKNRTFQINGEIKKTSGKTYGFLYEIKDNARSICKIFKEYKYFMNEYEIYINREFGFVDDPIFITTGVYIDSILRENGYQYK